MRGALDFSSWQTHGGTPAAHHPAAVGEDEDEDGQR